MRSIWTNGIVAGVLVMAGTSVGAASEPPGKARLVRVGQSAEALKAQYDELTNLWFTTQVDAQGQPSSEVKGRDLQIKKSFANRQLTLEIKAGSRALTIKASPALVELRTGRRVVKFDPQKATEANYDAAKQLLAESRVVGRLRAAAAATNSKILDGPQGTDLLLSDALVGLLDGDPGASERVRGQMRDRMLGKGLTVAAAGGYIGDCYTEYRNAIYEAFMEAERCVSDFSVFNVPMRNLCNLEYTLRAEAIWFEFIGCSFGRAVRLM